MDECSPLTKGIRAAGLIYFGWRSDVDWGARCETS